MTVWDDRVSRVGEIRRQVAGFVVAELGDAWKVDTSTDPTWRTTYADGPDGARIGFALDWHESSDRLEISGTWPDGWTKVYGIDAPPKITVRRDRDPRAIARDITRRLLPEYLGKLPDVRDRLQRNADADAARLALAAEIRDTYGATDYPSGEGRSSLRLSLPDGFADLEVSSGGSSVSLEIRYVPADVARRVLSALTGRGE